MILCLCTFPVYDWTFAHSNCLCRWSGLLGCNLHMLIEIEQGHPIYHRSLTHWDLVCSQLQWSTTLQTHWNSLRMEQRHVHLTYMCAFVLNLRLWQVQGFYNQECKWMEGKVVFPEQHHIRYQFWSKEGGECRDCCSLSHDGTDGHKGRNRAFCHLSIRIWFSLRECPWNNWHNSKDRYVLMSVLYK
jgi:hypothetical protein